jgi:tRNA(His) 5'-end guanylyltransferase
MSVLCTQAVMSEFPDVRVAFGESDEYSFVLHKGFTVYGKCCPMGARGFCSLVMYVRTYSTRSWNPDAPGQ